MSESIVSPFRIHFDSIKLEVLMDSLWTQNCIKKDLSIVVVK